MVDDLLKRLQHTPGAIDALEKELQRKRLGPDGREHPLFSWRPGCPPYETSAWERPGRAYFQKEALHSKAFLTGICCANGVGKSEFGARYTAARFRCKDPLTDREWEGPQNIWVLGEPDLIPKLFDLILKYIPNHERGRIHYARGHQFVEHKQTGSRITMKSTGMEVEQFQMENVNFLWADEESPSRIWTECMMRMRCRDSQVMLTFTPVGGTQFMYDTLKMDQRERFEGKLDGDLSLFFARMDDNPFLPEDYIRRAKEECARDSDMYAIRIDGEYRLMGGKVIFDEDVLRQAWDHVEEPQSFVRFDMDGKLIQMPDDNTSWALWKQPLASHRYVIGADLAEGGLEGDFTAAHILDVTNGEIVARFHGKLEPGEFGRDLMLAGYYYGTALLNWEMNMQGAAVWHVVQEWGYPRIYRRESMGGKMKTMMQTVAFRTDRHSKPTVISTLRDAFSDGIITCHDIMTLRELSHFAYLRKEDTSARTMGMGALPGCHDDLAISLAITWRTAGQSEDRGWLSKPEPTFAELLEEDALSAVKRSQRKSFRQTQHPRLLM